MITFLIIGAFAWLVIGFAAWSFIVSSTPDHRTDSDLADEVSDLRRRACRDEQARCAADKIFTPHAFGDTRG